MSPEDELERRVRANEQQVVRLDERMDYGTRDRDLIRREMAEGFASVRADIAEVDAHCERRFREAAETVDRRFKEAADVLRSDQTSKRGVTVAWIGGGFLLIATIINTLAATLGAGP